MKRTKADTAETRRRIVEAAAKAFRKQGIEATGVAEIMTGLGLTHGGFYRHFASKEELVSEAMSASRKNLLVDSTVAAEESAKALLDVFPDYVTEAYRDDLQDGCPLAANGSELVRASEPTRENAIRSVKKIVANMTPFIKSQDGQSDSDTALNLLTNMVGALTAARISGDKEFSDRILEITRRRIASLIDLSKEPVKKEEEPAAA